MKKIFAAFMALMIMGSVAMANPDNKKDAKKATKEAATTTTKTKSDGTPDMRYKENKDKKDTAPKADVKLKKDGTPDMRYKDNKETGTKKK